MHIARRTAVPAVLGECCLMPCINLTPTPVKNYTRKQMGPIDWSTESSFPKSARDWGLSVGMKMDWIWSINTGKARDKSWAQSQGQPLIQPYNDTGKQLPWKGAALSPKGNS